MRHSKYWDDFEKRIQETVYCLKNNLPIPTRRVACFITDKCNFRCQYCNCQFGTHEISEQRFDEIVSLYSESIIHITGGEPSVVKWLYPYIENHKARFHLNTNAYIEPPKNIQRLKVSLDSYKEDVFNQLVQHNAFATVVDNISKATDYTTVSITCLLNKQTYKQTPQFMAWCRKRFPKLYAVFFSVYKGNNTQFALSKPDVDCFINEIKPKLENEMDGESLALLNETIDSALRISKGVRFPENAQDLCYLSMSERVVDWNGVYHCSHLYRDGVRHFSFEKCSKCLYGCNKRLVDFNREVKELL